MNSKASEQPREGGGRNFRAYYALLALVVGLIAGILSGKLAESAQADALATASFVGTLWLNALKMTVIPLVVALLVVGIAKSAEAAQAGRIAGRSVLWIVLICTGSAIFGALSVIALTHAFPLARDTAELLRGALGGIEQKSTVALPGAADFFKGIVPPNVVAAAGNGDVLPLTVFAVLF
ncbi:MAG TPA: cation:dicarboxylase symporter family transporter, partial [Sphingomicrobium sp.]|nr:cation:dicarboxylase symporter family transporter [Sphingomicrobium sp.]